MSARRAVWGIPPAPLALGLAGLLPFAWGVLTLVSADAYLIGNGLLGTRFVAPHVSNIYGAIILSFMSGVLWGFATKVEGRRAATGYALSVIPAIYLLFAWGGPGTPLRLALGFVALLALDWLFQRWGLAPAWWLRLRLILTVGVVACLLPLV
ncbi:MAG: DUF3429 domain-containing protein [Paracoccaceae bacterium]